MADAGGEVLLGIGGDCVEDRDPHDCNTGKLQNAERIVAGSFMNKSAQPSIRGLATQDIIENDLQRPRFKQIGSRLSNHRQKAEDERASVWAQ